MKASSFFGGQYLTVSDLDGKQITAKINAVGTEVLEGSDGKERERIILHLDGLKKPAVLNATNGAKIIGAWGDETDDWAGRKVMVSKGKVMFRGKLQDGIVIVPIHEEK